jgi:hypothetical protein
MIGHTHSAQQGTRVAWQVTGTASESDGRNYQLGFRWDINSYLV